MSDNFSFQMKCEDCDVTNVKLLDNPFKEGSDEEGLRYIQIWYQCLECDGRSILQLTQRKSNIGYWISVA